MGDEMDRMDGVEEHLSPFAVSPQSETAKSSGP
jgi:hypothetical protein